MTDAGDEMEILPPRDNDEKPIQMITIDDTGEHVKTPEEIEAQDGTRDAVYWHKEYAAVKADNDKRSMYDNIIKALENDASLVDVVQQHMFGQPPAESKVDEDPYGSGLSNEYEEPSVKSASTSFTKEDIEAARQQGATEAAGRVEFDTFMQTLTSAGIPDHKRDKFIKALTDPSYFTLQDAYDVFDRRKLIARKLLLLLRLKLHSYSWSAKKQVNRLIRFLPIHSKWVEALISHKMEV